MTKLAIAAVDANAPKPFTATPFLTLTLASQLGTDARYVQNFPAGTSMQELEGEVRTLEIAGEIEQAVLDSAWRLDVEGMAEDAAQFAGNDDDAAFDREGMPVAEIEIIEEVEPLA